MELILSPIYFQNINVFPKYKCFPKCNLDKHQLIGMLFFYDLYSGQMLSIRGKKKGGTVSNHSGLEIQIGVHILHESK